MDRRHLTAKLVDGKLVITGQLDLQDEEGRAITLGEHSPKRLQELKKLMKKYDFEIETGWVSATTEKGMDND